MCCTGNCNCKDIFGDCVFSDNCKCFQPDPEDFILKEKKEQELFEKKLKDIILFLLKELNIEFSLEKKKFIYLPDCLNITNYKSYKCYSECQKIVKCEKYFKFVDKLNEGIIENLKDINEQ